MNNKKECVRKYVGKSLPNGANIIILFRFT